MLVICGPGSNREFKALHEIIKHLPSSNPRIRVAVGPGEAASFAKKGIKRKEEVIILIGGDRMINEVLPVMVFEETRLAIIPIGRKNDIARHLKVPIKPGLAIRAIIECQHGNIDVVKVASEYFLRGFELGSVIPENGSIFDRIAGKFSFKPFPFSLRENGKEIHKGEILSFKAIVKPVDGLEIDLASSKMESFGFKIRNRRTEKGEIGFFSGRDLVAAVDGRTFLVPKGDHEIERIPKAIRLIQVS